MARSNQLASLAVDIVINARRFRSTLRQTRGDLEKTGKSSRGLATNITRIGLAASAFLIIQRAANLVITVIKETTLAFAKLEKQIIDIEKIAKINISEQFFGLAGELPSASFENISEVMAGAARAGIQGAEGLKEFSKAVIILSEVSGDIIPAEASIGIAQLLKNFDLGTDKALQLANNIDVLSDNFVTTSGAILTSSKRLAGFASTVGISVDELNALVAALLQTGATATTVRTTLGAIFTKIIPKSLEAGRAMGLVGDELINFATIVGAGGVEGLKFFINTLKKLPETKAQEFLKKMGIAGSRTQLVLKLLAKTTDGELDRALKLSADSINTVSNVLLKYERVAKSADTTVKDLSKQYTILKTNFGGTAVFSSLRDILRGLNEDFDNLISPKALKNLDDINEKLREVEGEIKSIKGRFNVAPVGIIGGGGGRSVLGRAEQTGKLARLKDEQKRLKFLQKVKQIEEETEGDIGERKARIAQLQAEEKAEAQRFPTNIKTQQAGIDAYVKALLAHEEKAGKVRLDSAKAQKEFIDDMLDSLPTLKTGLEATLESIEKERQKRIKALEDAGVVPVTGPAIVETQIHFDKLAQAARDSAQAIIDEKRNRKELTAKLKREREIEQRKKIIAGGIGGKTGEAIAFQNELQKIFDALTDAPTRTDIEKENVNKAIKSIADFLKIGRKNILDPSKEIKPPQFKGLTQAWKDAVVSIDKKETPFEKAQKKFWKDLLAVGAAVDFTLKAVKKVIEEQEEAVIK